MKLVLDTSFFTNPDSYSIWGDGVSRAMDNFITKAKTKSEITFYLPPTVLKEITSFFDDYDRAPLRRLEALVEVKSPFVEDIKIPVKMFYDVVLEIRARSYKGLRISETALKNAVNGGIKPDDLPTVIKKLRQDYRQALRFGFLDSQADLDLVFLAYQLTGTIVSLDTGVIDWARRFGIATLTSQALFDKLTDKKA